MKNILLIIFIALSVQSFGQVGWFFSGRLKGDTLYMYSNTGDSTQVNRYARVWGQMQGALSDQTDLQTALNAKQATLVSATNIKTVNGSSLLGSGDVVIGGSDPTKLAILNNLSDLDNAATARTNLSLGNVTNESKATMFTNATFTGTFNVADGAIANADLANGAVANLSGTNTGDNATNTQYSGLAASKADIASPAFTGTPTGIGIPRYAQVTGSNATTTGQVLVDITGLSLALVANAVYEFEAVMTGSTTAVTTGTAYGVNYSVAGGAIEASISGASTSTAMKNLRITAFNSATALYLATSAQTGGIIIKGRVTTGANAGNLTIQHLKLTSGTSTIFIGSFLKVTRIS